jgi:SAM-dependent methyltransferase
LYEREFNPDFGLTARDYGRHRAGFPRELGDRLIRFGIGVPGQDVLDLGTGTGSLARLFAQAGATVPGVDPAISLLEQAGELDRACGVEIDYGVGTAEETGLPDASFDVAGDRSQPDRHSVGAAIGVAGLQHGEETPGSASVRADCVALQDAAQARGGDQDAVRGGPYGVPEGFHDG